MILKYLLFLVYLISLFKYGLTINKTAHHLRHRKSRDINSLKPVNINIKPENFDYLVKVLPNLKSESMCSSLKKISASHPSLLKISESLSLNNDDLLQCEVANADYQDKKPRLVIHTPGSLSDPSFVTKFTNPTNDNCFSFTVQTAGVATISLYNDLKSHNYITIELGLNNNTESYMIDKHHDCDNCRKTSTPNILSAFEFKAFWITWKDNRITIGEKDKDDYILENSFYGFGEIKYIGLSSPFALPFSTWTIEEPFCPTKYLDTTLDKERTIYTKCHKVFDNAYLSLLHLSSEKKLLKRLQALSAEYDIENLTPTTINVKKIKDYYYHSIDTFYFEEYMNLLKNCISSDCDKTILDTIKTTIEDLRKTLKEKIEELISKPQCSTDGYYDQHSEKCICNSRYAGNGVYCKKDTDMDGFPDEDIPECNDKSNCRKDNCPYDSNPYQEDSNDNGIGDACDSKSSNSEEELYDAGDMEPSYNSNEIDLRSSERDPNDLNCANMMLPENVNGKKCVLETDFTILQDYNEKQIQLIFSQARSNKIYRFTWTNNYVKRFLLNKLDDITESSNDWESGLFRQSNLIWSSNNKKTFEKGKSYRIIIHYAPKKIQFRLESEHGPLTDSYELTANDIQRNEPIERICTLSDKIRWVKPTQKCD